MNNPLEDRADYSRTPPDQSRVPDHCAGWRLDRVLAEVLPQHSRNRLQTWVREGRVAVGGRIETEPKHKLAGGEVLVLSEPPGIREIAEQPEDIPLDIVFEDEALLVIDKPPGLVVHPGSGNWSGTLMNALLHHVPAIAEVPRAGIVHRLDKDTSGLLVVAKTDAAHHGLQAQFAAHDIERRYLAVVHGIPDPALARRVRLLRNREHLTREPLWQSRCRDIARDGRARDALRDLTKRIMGYLKDFRESFAKRLDALDPEEMKEALNIACNARLESYRNGQKSAQPEPRAKQGGEAHSAKRPARAWKKRTT